MSVHELKAQLYGDAAEVEQVGSTHYGAAIESNGRVISGMELVVDALKSAVGRGKMVKEEMSKEQLAVNGAGNALDAIAARLAAATQSTESDTTRDAVSGTHVLAATAGSLVRSAVYDTDKFGQFIDKISSLINELEGDGGLKNGHHGMEDVYESEVLGLGGNAARIRSAADSL